MKLVAFYVFVVLCIVLGWFFATFTVFRAAENEGFLVLYDKEAAECAVSECAVFSDREFRNAVMRILHGNMTLQRPQPPRDGTL